MGWGGGGGGRLFEFLSLSGREVGRGALLEQCQASFDSHALKYLLFSY